MRKNGIIKVFMMVIILFSVFSSILGVLNYRTLNFSNYVTLQGHQIQYLTEGIYKYNVKSWVLAGIPWDIVRLFPGIPLLVISFILYLKNSIKGTLILVGLLLSFFYQYLLWAIGWHFNSLFLIYTFTYSLCLITIILISLTLTREKPGYILKKDFPQKLIAGFLFLISALLLFKCLGEVFPNMWQGELSSRFSGYYTLFDQSLDLGLVIPFCIFSGILLLKNNPFGLLFSISGLIMFFNVGLAVIAGEVISGLTSCKDKIELNGVLVFSILLFIDVCIIFKIFRHIKPETDTSSSDNIL